MLTLFQKSLLGTIAGAAMLLALVLAARGPAFAATLPAVLAPPTGGLSQGILTVGDATVKVKPDIALLGIGATAQADSAEKAQALVAQRIDRILGQAKALGFADKDVKTVGYNIAPQYAYDQGKAPRITGYQATQMLQLTLRQVDEAGRALDRLVQSDGATNASISFALDDPKAAQASARKLAVEDARSKADAMAQTAGVRVGRVLAITDSSPQPIPFQRFDLAQPVAAPVPAPSTQVPAGDLQIVVRVQVQFEIQ
jgi:hypothetical protein